MRPLQRFAGRQTDPIHVFNRMHLHKLFRGGTQTPRLRKSIKSRKRGSSERQPQFPRHWLAGKERLGQMTPEEKQSGIPCQLIGEDGNIYNLLAIARNALRRGGRADLIEPMTKAVFASKSYEEALAHICEYVEAE